MSNEPLILLDSADELQRLVESHVKVRISFPRTRLFIFGSRATALEMAAALTVGDRLRTAGEPLEKDLNFVDRAGRVVQTPSMPMTYQSKFTEPAS